MPFKRYSNNSYGAAGQGNYRFDPGYYNDSFGIIETAALEATQWTYEQYRDTGLLVPKLRHDQNDYFQLRTQFDHKRKLQSVLGDIHIHIVPLANGAGNIYFSVTHHWHKDGDVIPELSGWTNTLVEVPILTTDQYKHLVKQLVTNINPPVSEGYSSSLLIKVSRLGTNALDTYNTNAGSGTAQANVALLYMDCHTIQNRHGSINTYED